LALAGVGRKARGLAKLGDGLGDAARIGAAASLAEIVAGVVEQALEALLSRAGEGIGRRFRERGAPAVALVDLDAAEAALLEPHGRALRRVFDGEGAGVVDAEPRIAAPLTAPAAMGRGGSGVEIVRAARQRGVDGGAAFPWPEARPALHDDGAPVGPARGGLEHVARLVADLPAARALLLLGVGAARAKHGEHGQRRADDRRERGRPNE